MRFLAILLLVAAPGEDLMPREGAGWAGFKPGTWIRLKQTRVQPGRMLAPTITNFTLQKADARTITLSIKAENALGVSGEAQQAVVPVSGDAGTDETEKVEGRGEEGVSVAGREVACDRVQSTVTGPAGKRVITKWIAREPKVLVKRVTVTSDIEGNESSRESLLLSALEEVREVAGRKIRCLKYVTQRKEADFEWAGTAYMSREMPGGLVWSEDEIRQKGAVVLTQRAEVLEFVTK